MSPRDCTMGSAARAGDGRTGPNCYRQKPCEKPGLLLVSSGGAHVNTKVDSAFDSAGYAAFETAARFRCRRGDARLS
jgi:hypothetical protein